MSRYFCRAQIVAVALSAALLGALSGALAGCGTVALFGKYDIPESPEVAAAPWPRLIDTPAAPPVGTYTPAVPDPAEGAAALVDLSAAGATANARAAELAAPVVPGPAAGPAAPMTGRASAPAKGHPAANAGPRAAPAARQAGRAGPAADDEIAAAAAARAAALAGPVIGDAERDAMLEAARRSPPAGD